MRVVTLEEHVSYPDLSEQIPEQTRLDAGWLPRDQSPKAVADFSSLLSDEPAERLGRMNEAGVDVQVLSFVGAGAELVRGTGGDDFAREANARIAQMVRAAPDRFAGFAHLPMLNPESAAVELEHAVDTHGFKGALINGGADGVFLDDPRFAPVLETASALRVPLYLHPGIPPLAVRDAYYRRLPTATATQLAQAGFGWHAEVAVHVLRLALSGTLDRYPELQIIVGHMGETLPFMLDRIDREFARDDDLISEPVSTILRKHLWVTTSGMFTRGPFDLLRSALGAERTMFSIDFPFENLTEGIRFLNSLNLEDKDFEDFSHGTADRLLGLETA